jgi:hypothetical protein
MRALIGIAVLSWTTVMGWMVGTELGDSGAGAAFGGFLIGLTAILPAIATRHERRDRFSGLTPEERGPAQRFVSCLLLGLALFPIAFLGYLLPVLLIAGPVIALGLISGIEWAFLRWERARGRSHE